MVPRLQNKSPRLAYLMWYFQKQMMLQNSFVEQLSKVQTFATFYYNYLLTYWLIGILLLAYYNPYITR